jgi:hypothetical protein
MPTESGFRTLENRGLGWAVVRVAIRATAVLHDDLRVNHPTRKRFGASVQTSTQERRV